MAALEDSETTAPADTAVATVLADMVAALEVTALTDTAVATALAGLVATAVAAAATARSPLATAVAVTTNTEVTTGRNDELQNSKKISI